MIFGHNKESHDIIIIYGLALSQPLSNSKTMAITPNNLRAVASYLDDNVHIDASVIRVITGSRLEILIQVPLATLVQVPLANAGEIDPQATIRLTVGFDSDQITTNTYARVGLSDGNNLNQFHVYGTSSNIVCRVVSYSSNEGNTANEGTLYYPGEVTMLFQPFYKYGSCATGHDGGHVNVGTVLNTVDLSRVFICKLTIMMALSNITFISLSWKCCRTRLTVLVVTKFRCTFDRYTVKTIV